MLFQPARSDGASTIPLPIGKGWPKAGVGGIPTAEGRCY